MDGMLNVLVAAACIVVMMAAGGYFASSQYEANRAATARVQAQWRHCVKVGKDVERLNSGKSPEYLDSYDEVKSASDACHKALGLD